MVRVRLRKGAVDPGLITPSFRELLDYVGCSDVDLGEVQRLIDKTNGELIARGLRVEIRKPPPWDKEADYRLILR